MAKSSGLFPHRKARTPTNMFGGSAGESRSNNRPTSGDGYKDGSLGWRSSRQGGGQSMMQKMAGRPMPNDTAIKGSGGLAYDRSAAVAFEDKGRPADSKRR